MTDPAAFIDSNQWVPIVTGIVIALVVHLAKMMVRPALNAVTVGAAAPVVSTVEDASSAVLSVIAILIPILVIIAVIGMIVATVVLVRRLRRRKRTVPA